LIYDGVYLLDFAGPLEIFNDAILKDNVSAFEVFLVSPNGESITTHTNTIVHSTYSFKNCPQPDILVIPGGNLNLSKESPTIAKWITETSDKSEIVMSVCTGAYILADLGLLDGLEVITWYGAADRLQKLYPNIKIQKGKRFTDNGKIITTAGVSAGMDGSLHIIEKLFGREIALKTAKYIEYNWNE
jgi:transcriptional regulator GlxA family with amidase domain